MRKLILAVAILVPALSLADPTPVTPAATPTVTAPVAPAKPASSLDTNKDGKVDKTETAAATNADATVSDVIKNGTDVVSAAKDLKNPALPKALAIAVLLGAAFKLLLSLIKVLGKNIKWFTTQAGKRTIKYSTLGLGALAALTANLALGTGWIDALTILFSGPLAVAIHEYTSDSSPDEAPAAPAPAAPAEPPKA